MSLINDALKRARLSREKQKPSSSEDPPLEPAETPPPSKRSPWLWVPVCVLLGGGGIWFVWQWWNSPAQALAPELTHSTAPGQSELVEPAVETPGPIAPTSVVEQIAIATNEVETSVAGVSAPQASTNTIVASTETEPPPSQTETSPKETIVAPDTETAEPAFNIQPAGPVAFPPLTLQGIFFRLNNPSVLINNRTLFLGSKVDGVTVVEIQRYKVVFEFNGSRKELFLK